jgi:TnpA family transposase
MPVNLITLAQRESYGRYVNPPTPDELSRCFHIHDGDRALITQKRGNHNRLGFALQLVTVRFLGIFLEDPLEVPPSIVQMVAKQLEILNFVNLHEYRAGKQRWEHKFEICMNYGYQEITDPRMGFRFIRWLYALCWTGTNRPSVLFDRAKIWLLTNKVLLPGVSVLERIVARVRNRSEERLWRILGKSITPEQKRSLKNLLIVPEGKRGSLLDKLRWGPNRVSAPAFVYALKRIETVNNLGISISIVSQIPPSRLTSLARFAMVSKITAIIRLPPAKQLATLVAFMHCLKATALDDALDVLDMLLRDLFSRAIREDKKKRLRTLKDLDQASTLLAKACQIFIDPSLADAESRQTLFTKIPRETLLKTIKEVEELVRPPDDVFYQELIARYRHVRRFLVPLLKGLHFDSNAVGKPVVAALNWMLDYELQKKPISKAPRDVISRSWNRYVFPEAGEFDYHAYTFCVLNELHIALRRRDIFINPSWRYSDPRAGLLSNKEWESTKPIICRTLDLSDNPQPVLAALSKELDQTYKSVMDRLPNNPALRFETVKGKSEFILTPLDRLEESASLKALRSSVMMRLPRIDLPEILLEIAARTKFTDAFIHITERSARAEDLMTSLCAVLLADACNTGIEPLIRNEISALKRGRLSWVSQNYVRDDTLTDANAQLVAAQSKIPLATAWGGGDVASADGLRFVVPIRTVHAGPNSKYFGSQRGVTWYNLVSNQFSGLNAITVPGTLRDSLILLAVVLEQQTDLQPTQVMTDTGAYSDVIFGLFRLLGYRFSPRIADVSDTRLWRIDPKADYGSFESIARHKINMQRIAESWDDLLRLAGSLKLGRVSATGIMRTLQVGDRSTRIAQALVEFGRIEKTLHILNYIDDENFRRSILTQLNRGEGRHSLARMIFHGKRGELRQRYREGQEDQLGALGLVLNIIVIWNTVYIDAILAQLRLEGHTVKDEDVARLSPLVHEHINMLGRYSFAVPESVIKGNLRPLRNPKEEEIDS